jgi:mRNA-degrading endonuclease RelE of RelBE toxin-antitoxin system
MTDPPASQRWGILWSPEARNDLRAIDREQALQILYCVSRFITDRIGDVKKLKPPLAGLRLRCGDYRVFFDHKDGTSIEITAVRHRKDAYR